MVRALCLLAILAGCDGIFRLDKIGDRPPPDAPDVIDAPDASVPAGLAAWFEMEDLTSSTAIDSAGNHEGVCGTDQCPAVVAGKVGYAFAFDGTSKVIRAPSGGDLDIASDLTIAMWARVDETPSEFACAVNKLYGKNNGDSWQFCAYGPTSSWFLYVESRRGPRFRRRRLVLQRRARRSADLQACPD